MQEVYLCLDVGGTEIKAAPLDKRGNYTTLKQKNIDTGMGKMQRKYRNI